MLTLLGKSPWRLERLWERTAVLRKLANNGNGRDRSELTELEAPSYLSPNLMFRQVREARLRRCSTQVLAGFVSTERGDAVPTQCRIFYGPAFLSDAVRAKTAISP